MSTLTEINSGRTTTIPHAKRSMADLLATLDRLAQVSPSLIAKPGGTFQINGQAYELPRYAAELILPRNQNDIIDGFNARHGIIREGYQGVLSAPPSVRPRPFEIILETPKAAPRYQQE